MLILSLFFSVDGGFSDWTVWDTCSVTCSVGTQSRTRDCTNPAPAYGGADCTGDMVESQNCDKGPCLGRHISWDIFVKKVNCEQTQLLTTLIIR